MWGKRGYRWKALTYRLATGANRTSSLTLQRIQLLQQVEGDEASRVIWERGHMVVRHEQGLHSRVHVHPDVGLELPGKVVQDLHLRLAAAWRYLSRRPGKGAKEGKKREKGEV